MSRPFVFSFVSVNGSHQVLGTREVDPDHLEDRLVEVLGWLAAAPERRCATLPVLRPASQG
jgi:hypothetical protein